MRDKRDVMRLHIKNGIRDLNSIRDSYNSFGNGGFTQRTDAIQSYTPRDRFEPIPISQEQQFNLKHFGQFNRPEQLQQRQQTIQQPSKIKESQESKRLAEERINNRERLQKFEEEQRIDKERELKVAPYAAMGLVGTATGTLPAMIAGEIGGRAVNYGSKKLTGKSWGENVLPEAPMIGELTNPGYLIGGLAGQYRNQISDFVGNGFSIPKKFYHGSPYNWDSYDISRIGTGEGASKYGYGLNVADHKRIAPKFANILAEDAAPHFGRGRSKAIESGAINDLDPRIYEFTSKKKLKLYDVIPKDVRTLDQNKLAELGYDGLNVKGVQQTIFPGSVKKLRVSKSTIDDFVNKNKDVDFAP